MAGRSILTAAAVGVGLAVSTVAVAQSSGGSEPAAVDAVGADVTPAPPPADELRSTLRSAPFLDEGWELVSSGRVVTAQSGTEANPAPSEDQAYPTIPLSEVGRWTEERAAEAAKAPTGEGIEGEAYLYAPSGTETVDSWLTIKVYAKGVEVDLPPGGRAVDIAGELVHVVPFGPDAPAADAILERLAR
jgi:hypothetical protein